LNETNRVVVLERKCPSNKGHSYSLYIDSEGDVEYDGISGVKTMGKHISKITREDLNALIDEFKIIYFFSLKDSYGNLEDSPNSCVTSLSLSLGKEYKKITHLDESRVPYSLRMLEKKIEKMVKLEQWTGITE
jgi:hypothetical protein